MKRAILSIAVAMLAVACGGDDQQADGVATLEDTTPQQATTTIADVAADEALIQFSQCMRDEGIPLPDIPIDEDGAPVLDPALLDVIDVESDEFNDAFAKCQPILSSSAAFNVEIDPELEAVIMDQLFTFSQCMRDNGFDDFPDPGEVGGGAPPYPLTVFTQLSDPDFEAAVELCQRDLAFPGAG